MKKILFTILFCMIAVKGWAATFGYSYTGSETGYSDVSTDRIYCFGPYPISENGTASSITALLRTTTGTANVKAVLYDDNGTGGDPGTILGVTTTASVTTAKTSYTFNFSSGISVTTGSYWVGIVSPADSIRFFIVEQATSSNDWLSSDSGSYYTTPPNNPTQASQTAGYDGCIYVTYTPGDGGSSSVSQPIVISKVGVAKVSFQ